MSTSEEYLPVPDVLVALLKVRAQTLRDMADQRALDLTTDYDHGQVRDDFMDEIAALAADMVLLARVLTS